MGGRSVSDLGREGTIRMPRLSHTDAENLISARLDAPLPPDQNRALLAHLATCPNCRAFAEQMSAMSQGFRTLPMLPASPTVTRQVRERINQPQSGLARFGRWMFAGQWGAMPAVATALVLVAAVAFSIILTGDNGSEPNIQAAAATETAQMTTARVSETAAASPTPTSPPKVTHLGTSTPLLPNIQITLSPTPKPTETNTPAPTATSTETPTRTATTEPTKTPTPTDTPVDTATGTAT